MTELFANPLPAIDAAGPGSTLLPQLQTIKSTVAWLAPLKFLGVAIEFLAITMGLAAIIAILRAQTQMLDKGVHDMRAAARPSKVLPFQEKRKPDRFLQPGRPPGSALPSSPPTSL